MAEIGTGRSLSSGRPEAGPVGRCGERALQKLPSAGTANVSSEVVALVGGLLGCEPGLSGEQPARYNMIGGLVDRLDADQSAAAEAEHREVAA